MDSPQPDETLMANVALGQRAPLEVLVRRYGSALLTFIRRMVGDPHRSEELFQEVFLAVWCKRHQYEFPRSFKNWLYAIAVNKCRADFRARTGIQSFVEEDAAMVPSAPGLSPVETMIAAETATRVAGAVARLPEQQRLVVVLRIWQGLSYAAIADLLGVSDATVRSHMHHALTTLRKHLEAHVSEQ